MSIYKIKSIITSHLYIVYSEKYQSPNKDAFIERYVAKHPLLKPELIVVNDQLHGFKQITKKLSSLEDLPIYVEIEGIINNENTYFIDSIDLYCETNINCQKRLADMIHVSHMFSKFVQVDRNINVANPKEETLFICSKLNEMLVQSFFTEDENTENSMEDIVRELVIDIKEFNELLSIHLKYFVQFIKVCNDMLINDKPLTEIKSEIETFLSSQ